MACNDDDCGLLYDTGCGSLLQDHDCSPTGCERDQETYEFEGDCATLLLGPVSPQSESLDLIDCWAQEQADTGTIPVQYWPLDPKRFAELSGDLPEELAGAYREPHKTPYHNGPFTVQGLLKSVDRSNEGTEKGQMLMARSELHILRQEFDKIEVIPQVGDIVKFWADTPFFRRWANVYNKSREGYYFEVSGLSERGYPFSGPSFLSFRFELRRSTRYVPERKLQGDDLMRTPYDG